MRSRIWSGSKRLLRLGNSRNNEAVHGHGELPIEHQVQRSYPRVCISRQLTTDAFASRIKFDVNRKVSDLDGACLV